MADCPVPKPVFLCLRSLGPRQPVVETLATALRSRLPSQHHAEASGPRVFGGHKTLPLSTAYRREAKIRWQAIILAINTSFTKSGAMRYEKVPNKVNSAEVQGICS